MVKAVVTMFAAMRYFVVMAILVPTLTILAAALVPTPAAKGSAAPPSPAMRIEGGPSATVTVSARIISASARIGPSYGPPAPRMLARRTSVSAADGRAVAALVYDFE